MFSARLYGIRLKMTHATTLQSAHNRHCLLAWCYGKAYGGRLPEFGQLQLRLRGSESGSLPTIEATRANLAVDGIVECMQDSIGEKPLWHEKKEAPDEIVFSALLTEPYVEPRWADPDSLPALPRR